MSIPTVYIRGTKKEANAKLAEGKMVTAVHYSMFDQSTVMLEEMPDGTVIKFWEKAVQGTPIAKSYGNWRPKKNKIA